MKKKFLSLMMAAAVVATTSVSAFAQDQEYEVSKVKEADANVTIKGDIADEGGHFVPSTISVTVPTATKFSVTKDGDTVSPTITITSRSEEPVSVIAKSFVDPTKNSDITVVGENELNGDNNKVALTLKGDEGSVVLKSEQGSRNGLYKLGGNEAADEDTVLGIVTKNAPVNLNLEVKVKKDGYSAPTKALTDNFKLVLKLKK